MIKVYSKENCNNCEMVKNKLKDSNIAFEEIHDENKMMEIGSDNGIFSAPIIQIDNEYYSGIDAIKKLGLA